MSSSRTLRKSLPAATVAGLALAATVPAHAVASAHGAPSPAGSLPAARVSPRGDPVAVAAREFDLQETGRLHAVGEPGTTVVERGAATGTFDCSTAVLLRIVSASKVTATFTVRPRGGSITGKGSARFAQKGANGYFGGTIAITGGTGRYAHAAGTNIGISGVISRESFALTVHVHGKIRV
jgi:hypothetical protein